MYTSGGISSLASVYLCLYLGFAEFLHSSRLVPHAWSTCYKLIISLLHHSRHVHKSRKHRRFLHMCMLVYILCKVYLYCKSQVNVNSKWRMIYRYQYIGKLSIEKASELKKVLAKGAQNCPLGSRQLTYNIQGSFIRRYKRSLVTRLLKTGTCKLSFHVASN